MAKPSLPASPRDRQRPFPPHVADRETIADRIEAERNRLLEAHGILGIAVQACAGHADLDSFEIALKVVRDKVDRAFCDLDPEIVLADAKVQEVGP